MGGAVLEMCPHAVLSLSVCGDTTVTFAAAHIELPSDFQRFGDADFLPSVSAPNLACHCLDHFCPSITPRP